MMNRTYFKAIDVLGTEGNVPRQIDPLKLTASSVGILAVFAFCSFMFGRTLAAR